MMSHTSVKIYWANALFSEADREFNAKCAQALRERGYDVFLPQETPMTFASAPTNEEIFRVDTEAIRKSDIVVACIDQFPIDAGVACEIGVAWASGIPVVGLYTDIRADRKGLGRMYKNQYVMGAIESSRGIVRSLEQMMEVLKSFEK